MENPLFGEKHASEYTPDCARSKRWFSKGKQDVACQNVKVVRAGVSPAWFHWALPRR
jgi:hypothetical protein